MDDAVTDVPRNSIAALRRFARPRVVRERCDLCAAELGEDHAHLFEPATRQVQCACEACALLFDSPGGKYRRVPRTIEHWPDFQITDEQWGALGVPIALAFFFFSTPKHQIVSMYPSPGGATEASLPSEVWEILCMDNPPLAGLMPEVEALLVNRLRGKRDYFRAPIDECFKLVGLIRTHWRGLSGGLKVWEEVEQFFDHLTARAGGGGAGHA